MEKRLQISKFEVVGSSLCVASGDGQRVYERLSAALDREERPVSLAFLNVSTLTAAFLNAAISQLYGNFDEVQIRKTLTAVDRKLLKFVIDSAKRYFKAP